MRLFFYRLMIFCFIFLFLAAFLIAMLPTIASTDWGTKLLVSRINQSIPGKVEIRSLDLHWSKGQDIEGFFLKDPDGTAVVKIEKLSTDATLWQLLQRSTRLGFTQMLDLNATIKTDDQGLTNLHHALGISKSLDSTKLLPSTIQLSEVNADLYLFAEQTPFSALIKGLTKQEDLNGSFEINIVLQNLKAASWDEFQKNAQKYLTIEGSKEAKVQAHVVNFPVDLIDRLLSIFNPQFDRFFHSLLGDRLDLKVEKEPSQEGLAFNIEALSPLMRGDLKGQISNGLISLRNSPGTFQFNLTPEFVNQNTGNQIEISNASLLKVVLSSFAIPLSFFDSSAKADPCQIELNMEITLPTTEMKVAQLGKMNLMNFKAVLDAPACSENFMLKLLGAAGKGEESFSFDFDAPILKPGNFSQLMSEARHKFRAALKVSHFPLEMIPELQKRRDIIDLIGSPADFQLTIRPHGKEEWNAALALQTPRLIIQEAQFKIGQEVNLTSPAEFVWEAAPKNLTSALKQTDLKLEDSYVLKFLLKEFHLSSTDPHSARFKFNHFVAGLTGQIDAKTGEMLSNISSHIEFWINNSHPDAAHTGKAEIQMHLEGVPSSFLSRVLSQQDMSPITGPAIDFHLKSSFDTAKDNSGFFDLKIDSANIHVNSRFKISESALTFETSKAPFVNLTITPASLDYLKKILDFPLDLKLASPVTLTGDLTDFNLPLKNSAQNPASIDFRLTSSEISWKNASTEPLKLDAQIMTRNLWKETQFSLKALSARQLTLEGTLSNLFDEQGKFRKWQAASLQTKVHGEKLTPAFLQSLFLLTQDNRQKVEAFFGESVDVKINCHVAGLSGFIQATALGKQGGLTIDGMLKNGIFTLNKPLEGSVKLTPLFTKTFLAPTVPLLSSAIGSEKPIRFSVDPDQFSCPLHPFRLDQVKIGKGILDLGKIQFKNEGDLSSVLSFIHSINDSVFSIWFTPLYFKLDKGILALKRLDMLVANSYMLATWGSLDLNKSQVDLVLGLSAQSLQYAFGIQGLDSDYMLQIPLHSVNGNVEIDKKRATARITSLVAQTQGGLKTKILGNILDAALSNSGEGATPPPVQPFPWKDEFKPPAPAPSDKKKASAEPETSAAKATDDSDTKKKKKKKKHKEQESADPIKGIQEGAIQLLDNLLKG